ncbi:MAG: 50S ribosomal protein L23 [Patescibacteria group bacterium]|nr:50S ribosomal protein L23 [Patescibacteria group bacterium]
MSLIDRLLKKKKEESKKNETPSKKEAVESTQKIADKEPVARKLTKTNLQSAAYKILLYPLVTEKAAIAESVNKYTFVVSRSANKKQIKKAMNDVYGVVPESVNTVNIDGRVLKSRGIPGRRSDYKKAIVALPAGKTINIHEGV